MIRWSTLVASPDDGTIDMVRLKSTAAVALALLGGVLIGFVTLVTLFTAHTIDLSIYAVMIGATVLPLTGGKIADGLSGRSASAKIQAGLAPDRRSGSTPAPPPAGT